MDLVIRDQDVLDYHSRPRPGKLGVRPTKPCLTQRDLSLAYTPGVAVPCLRIAEDPEAAYNYTNRSNLVAVISNGTAVLGLGNIGALAGKPVMEGKGVLFNRFAGIDVFDIELDTTDPDEFVRVVSALEPTFGGINLEDIKAPECFEIETRLAQKMQIPVFHDDQHGTAIIATAGLINALELQGKTPGEVRVVVLGAGAAGVACGMMFAAMGVPEQNIVWVDSRGVIHEGREQGMNPHKRQLARDTPARTLAEALDGADVFVGVSGANLVTAEMVAAMAPKPVIFAMANPDPEIAYDVARRARPDAIVATGRSDFPNQVNNVLGFPFIFRGALDVRARCINTEMKLAAAKALADLARSEPPEAVLSAYGVSELSFGQEYILPKPLDPRALLWVAPAVAQAAIETGAARVAAWEGIESYRGRLEALLGPSRRVMRLVLEKARRAPARIVFPEGEHPTVLRAAQRVLDDGICRPLLLGNVERIRGLAEEHGIELDGCEIVDPREADDAPRLAERLYELRQRRGVSPPEAGRLVGRAMHYGLLLVEQGEVNGLVGGIGRPYPEAVTPALQLIGTRPGVGRVASVMAVILPDHLFLFADPAINVDPSAETLAEMALLGAEAAAELFDIDPRVALLSFSNFGSVRDPSAAKVARAVRLVREQRPGLVVDGEMQPDVAVDAEVAAGFPHSRIRGDANVLVFPELSSAAISYRLISRLAGAETVGPILCGLSRPVNILTHQATVDEIVRAAAITVLQSRRAAVPVGG